MSNRNYINAIERGMKILEILGSAGRKLSLTEIASLCQMNRTAANRFLYTFCILGYINRDDRKLYELSHKALAFGFSYLQSSNLRTLCKPHIDELSAELDQTSNLAILDDLDIIYLYRREKKRFLRFLKYDLYDGSKLPSYCTSVGKVLLAGLDDDDMIDRIERMDLEPITPRTITSKKDLLKELMTVRVCGYAISDGELSMDLFSFAVPVKDAMGVVIASINLTISLNQLSPSFREKILRKLFEKGKLVSRLLGYQGTWPHVG